MKNADKPEINRGKDVWKGNIVGWAVPTDWQNVFELEVAGSIENF